MKLFILSKNTIDLWNRFKKNKAAIFGLTILILIFFIALNASRIAPYDPFITNLGNKFQPPGKEHLMGTDRFGRDIFSRLIWGTRVSLIVGLVSSGLSAVFGIVLGSIAGYFGKKIDNLVMRIAEIFLALPTFFFVLSITAIFGTSMWNVIALIGLTGWPSTARLLRAEFLTVKERDFVEAARAIGASERHIIFNEILPNAVHPAIVNTSLQSANAIMIEAGLSFLGLGDPNNISWGWMLNSAMRAMTMGWWMSFFPGIAIIIIVVAFNLVGDGLNDALNPRFKER
jgi:peptide/nickel transport system permease protein